MKNTILILSILLFSVFISCKKQPVVTQDKPLTVVAAVEKKAPIEKVKKPLYIGKSLDEKIGQMIMIGINDRKSLPSNDSLIAEIKSGKMGGIILFEKNIANSNSAETLKKLISDLQNNAPTPLFISIDEEGGKVHRLKEKYGFVSMPSAEFLGKLNNIDTTIYFTTALAKQLQNLGINLNYAPCLDLATNSNNPIIAKVGRSYSADPAIVATQAAASIQTHHAYGVKTIVKHFPGHGSSSSDSHLGIVDVTNQWNIIELLPYKTLIDSGYIDAVMTAHIINEHLDASKLPGTLSKIMVTDILRTMLGFDGVVFSDDMQMYAISKNYGQENAIKLSILAGVDVLVFGNNVSVTDRMKASEIHAIIKKLVLSGEIPESRINEAYERILTFKNKKVN
ncbi:glycoside hydrolase family 3 N-terminal domain-containing protein [uncultured Cytophaga sp.]|uniref:glycoside hydrolase family 3 protein n=1 Tax=uncultured Cytophaga sp. TaxID=160238 RepID=UPI00260AFA67|nr:glycoside hydrolase family 3 N-terminal domain-containing protein [uncultured Cytophaga sp.]